MIQLSQVEKNQLSELLYRIRLEQLNAPPKPARDYIPGCGVIPRVCAYLNQEIQRGHIIDIGVDRSKAGNDKVDKYFHCGSIAGITLKS